MRALLLLMVGLLTACTATFETRYPDECVMAKQDPETKQTIVSNFPCRYRTLSPPAPKGPS